MASMRGKRLKYFRDGFTLLEMTEEFDTRQIYVLNDVHMWEMASVFEKRLKYVRSDVDLWKNGSNMRGNGLSI